MTVTGGGGEGGGEGGAGGGEGGSGGEAAAEKRRWSEWGGGVDHIELLSHSGTRFFTILYRVWCGVGLNLKSRVSFWFLEFGYGFHLLTTSRDWIWYFDFDWNNVCRYE